MVERYRQRVCERVHETGATVMQCGGPTEKDLEASYWFDQREYYEMTDAGAVFKPDAPQRVTESYKLWKQLNS